MRARALIAIGVLAIALRAIGFTSYPATDAEIALLGSLVVPKSIVGQRVVALLFSTLAVIALARGLVRHGRPQLAVVATLLLAVDPLSIHAAHTSVRSAVLGVAGAFLVRAMLAGSRQARIGEISTAITMLVIAITTHDVATSPDPLLAAWPYSPLFGLGAAFLHHAGYVLVPLALFASAGERRLLLAVALPIVAACSAFGSIRLADLAGAAPALATLAACGLDAAARYERERGSPRLVVPGLLLLILASNAPVLVSDLLSGLRYPWAAANAWFASQRDLDPTTTRIFALEPAAAQRALGPRFTIERLPIADQGIAAALDSRPDDVRDRIVILPVSAGKLQGSARPDLLAEIEARKLADFAATARRFDLYRLELRIFRFR